MKMLMLATALTIATTAFAALAQPSQPGGPAPAAAQVAPGASGQFGMMGIMGGPQGMMGGVPMVNMMQMMGGPTPGMGMIDHVEGRIAFLRTELKITDAQAGVWNAFADTLRANAKKLGEARASMMSRMRSAQRQAPTLMQRLDLQEQWFTARLEGVRAIKTAYGKLHDSFSDEQKKASDELLAPNMGMGMMAMMPTGRATQ